MKNEARGEELKYTLYGRRMLLFRLLGVWNPLFFFLSLS